MFSRFSDIHLYPADVNESLFFPGPVPVKSISGDVVAELESLAHLCSKKTRNDFTVNFKGMVFRCRRETQVVDGVWLRLRRINEVFPTLDTLPSPIPPALKSLLMSPKLSRGGLVYITGAPGNGKTTTASATVISRLRSMGGVAYTIEDPPEMLLHGWHGPGFCSQTSVDGEQGWSDSLRGALRSQPANTPVMLYVGEIRDAESAKTLLQAAANGFLAISTGFSNDIITGIEAYLKLIGNEESNLQMLSGLLRLVVYQRLEKGRLQTSFLASASGTTPVASKIRSGNIRMLVDEIEQQRIQVMQGADLFG